MNTDNIYTAKENADGTFTLYRNGVAMFCPKTCYPIPVQSRIAGEVQIQVTKFNCATNCPFACIEKQGNDLCYVIRCEGKNGESEVALVLNEIIPLSKLTAK